MKLSELLKTVDGGENVQITALNDAGTDCVIKEGCASDLRNPESDGYQSGCWCGPTMDFLSELNVTDIHTKCSCESHSFSKEDDTAKLCRMAFKASSSIVVRLDITIAKINETQKKAWLTGPQGEKR